MNSPIPQRDATWIGRLFLQTDDLALIEISIDGLITDWHGASERMFGIAKSEAIGQPFALIFTPEDADAGMPALELSVALAQNRSEDDRWHRRRDESVFWASGIVQTIRDEAGEHVGFCKVMRDRTDLRSQIEALENRALADESREADRRDSLAKIAHELRNPLGAMTNALYLLGRAKEEAMKIKATDVINRQVDVLRRLVDDLSALSQAQVGKKILHVTSFDVQPVLLAALAGYRDEADRQGQTLNLVFPEGPITIEADEQRFGQMVMNLVSNALKYAPGGTVTVSTSVEGTSVAVRVDDDGVGIASEALQDIFDLFTRETRGKDAPEGLGVGLAVVKELARAHGGGVEARSPGKGLGSIFTLRLPQRSPLLAKDDATN